MFRRFWHRIVRPTAQELARKRDIEGLVWALETGDLGRQKGGPHEQAADNLIQIGRRAVPLLAEALQNPRENWQLKKNAADVLGNIGDVEAVPSLLTALNDANCNVQQGAILALAKIADERCIAPLIQKLADAAARFYVRGFVANALGRIAEKIPGRRQQILGALMEFVRDVAALDESLSQGQIPAGLAAVSDILHRKQEVYQWMHPDVGPLDQDEEVELLKAEMGSFKAHALVGAFKRLMPEVQAPLQRAAKESNSPTAELATWILQQLASTKDESEAQQSSGGDN